FFCFFFILLCLFLIPLWPLWYKTLKGFNYLFGLFSVWVIAKLLFKNEDFGLITKILVLSLIIIVIYGIYQYFWGLEITREMFMKHPEMMKNVSETYLDRMASNRIFATFVYPNTFAGYLLMIYPVVFFSIFSEKQKIVFRIANIIVLSLMVPVFAATESMGGWFCFLVVSFLMLLLFLIPKKFYFHFSASILLIGIFLAFIGIKTGQLPKIGSLTDRFSYWIAATEIFKRHTFIGVGPGNFSHFYLQFKLPGSMEAKFAHNLFFEILVSTGIIGTIVFVLSIFFFIKNNVGKILLEENNVMKGFFFGMAAFLLHCLVDFDYADAAITMFAFAFAGFVESSSTLKKQRFMRLTKLVAGIIIILVPFATVIEFKTWHVEKIIDSIKIGTIKEDPIQVLERASSIFPEPEIFFMQGEIFRYAYEKSRNIEFAEKAVNAYKRAIEINGFVPLYHRMLSKIYIEINNYSEAEKHLLKMIEIYPTKAIYNMEIGLFYKKIGRNELAKIYLEKSERMPPSSKDEARMLEEYKNGKSF
ncbi:MAG: O-antigen ligase family protein, partial [Candidatus Omnitrophica bacterium]|nr:O-antigen ligase family protein [Candidatus Omnitrophota bacterium]